MANSRLYQKAVFTLPNNVLKSLKAALSKYGNTNTSQRAQNLVANPNVSYSLAKKIKNFFDNYVSHNGNDATFELYGGNEMKNWINTVLGGSRNNITRSNTVRSNGGMENQFRKTHDKNPLKPTKVTASSLSLPKIKRMELFESLVEKDIENVAAISIIFNNEGKFLIVRRSETDHWMPNKWALVGGGIKTDEDAEEALVREIKEETNLTVKSIIYGFCTKEDEKDVYVFLAKCDKPDEIIIDPAEHSEHAWISIEECSNYETVPLVKEYVEKALIKFKEDNNKKAS